MKKIFLSVALLTAFACRADQMQNDVMVPELTAEQIEAQNAFFQNAGEQMLNNLLQNQDLAAWYNDSSDEEQDAFMELCVKYATLNLIVLEQNKPYYHQLFDELSELTGSTGWLAQLNFMSKEVAAAFQAQQDAQNSFDADDFDDEDAE